MFELIKKIDCKEIIFKHDRKSNLRCILIIDNASLGRKTVGGRITKDRKIFLEKNGKKTELKKFGFDHFTQAKNQK